MERLGGGGSARRHHLTVRQVCGFFARTYVRYKDTSFTVKVYITAVGTGWSACPWIWAGLYFLYVNANASASRNSMPPSADRQYSASAVHVAMQILREGDEIRKGRSLGSQDALQDLASTNQHPARLTCADLIFAIRSIRKVGLLLPQVGDHEVPSPAGFLASLSVQNVNQDSMYHRQATWTGNQLVISSRFIRALSKRTGWVCYNCCDTYVLHFGHSTPEVSVGTPTGLCSFQVKLEITRLKGDC